MEESSQPLPGAVSAQAAGASEKPAKPKSAQRSRKVGAPRKPRAAAQSGTAEEPVSAPATPVEPSVAAESQPRTQAASSKKSSAPRSRRRPSAAKNETSAPVAPASSVMKDEQPRELAAVAQLPVVREEHVPAIRESAPPALRAETTESGRSETVESAPISSGTGAGEGAAPEATTPSKRRRRRGGRGRKRPAADTASANAQAAIPLEAAEAVTPAAQQVSDSQNQQEKPALAAAQPEKSESGSAQAEPTAARSRSRSRASRSRGKKQAQTSHAPESVDPVTVEAEAQTAIAEGHETLALTADTPALLMTADARIIEPIPVVNSQEPRSGRSRRRGGRSRGRQPEQEQTVTQTAAPAQSRSEPRPEVKSRKLLVSVLPDDQVEVVVIENGKVREYYIEMTHQAKIRGNIYKGVISNIDTNLQAAFVNYGAAKNGFLQIDEIHPEYYLSPANPGKGHKYPPIQKVMKPGQEVLVQVGKEPTGNKGAFLTTWVSLAGRFLVLTPGQTQIGISRKVEDGEERNRLRELIKGLNPGEGLGAIVRTVSAGVTKTTMQKDLSYLKRLWKDIRKKGMVDKAPALVYAEPGLASRSMRDYLTDDVTEVWVDDESTATSMREMIALLFPRKEDVVKLHTDGRRTLFERFDVLEQLEQIHAREVDLPSGGRLVFDQTEALMAIDINSGKTGSNNKTNFETMAFRTNMEAAEVIPQQLRLRDIGGQVVVDFIEMRDQSQVREVEKTLRNAMKTDRARHDIGKISAFGLLEIVRQRTGSSAISISMEVCPFCQGTGTRRNMEWQALQALRDVHRRLRDAHDSGQTGLIYTVDTELAWYLLNHKRERLTVLEQELGVKLEIRPARSL